MPERERSSPYKVMGPFLGLDTVHQPREISPRHATIAHNVLLDNGTIQVRPPLEEDFRFSGYPPGRVYAGVDWYPPALTGALHDLVNVLHVDNMLFSNSGVISPVQRRQGTFVFAVGRLYYLDGLKVFKFDGQNWVFAGIPAPVVTGPAVSDLALIFGTPPGDGQILWRVLTGLAGTELPSAALAWATTYQFRFTFYDSVNQVESNSDFTLEYDTGADPGGGLLPFLGYRAGPFPPQRGITGVRAYVRNVTADQQFFVLWTETDGQVPNDFTGPLLGSNPDGSVNTESGPFVPYLNGVPEYASVGYYYKNRMFYNDLRDPTKLRYSADGKPDHVDLEADFERLDDDGGQITGMSEQAGQLVVIKERSAWIVSGVIFAPTNASVNLGVPRSSINKSHEVYQTRVTVGCANVAGGNGAFRVGGRVHYNGFDGLYAFDGLNERKVSGVIDPTWKLFVGDRTFGHNQAVSYCYDSQRDILYIVNMSIDEARVPILALHKASQGPGAGAWTTIGPDDPDDNPSCLIPVIGTQDFDAPLEPDGSGAELRPVSLAFAVGNDAVRVLVTNDRRDDLPMPRFAYASGRIVILEGLDKHFYFNRWFLSDSLPDGPLPRRIELGFRTSPRTVDEYKAIDVMGGIVAHHKVSEVGSDITVLLREPQEGDSRWHANLSILGFGLDAEPIGQ